MSDRGDFLERRRTGIGSSDAPLLIGLGWGGETNPAEIVYRSKVNPPPDAKPSGHLLRGIELEGIVAQKYTELTGAEVVTYPIRRHHNHKFMLANLDRIRARCSPLHPVELKTVLAFNDDWGEQGSALVPQRFYAQAQHQIEVAGSDFLDLCALELVTWEARMYRIARNDEFIRWLVAVEEEAWARIEQRIGFGDDWERRFRVAADALTAPLGRVALPVGAAALAARREEYGRIKRLAEKGYDSATRAIMAAMGDAHQGTAGGYTFTRKLVEGSTYTTTRKPYYKLTIRGADDADRPGDCLPDQEGGRLAALPAVR